MSVKFDKNDFPFSKLLQHDQNINVLLISILLMFIIGAVSYYSYDGDSFIIEFSSSKRSKIAFRDINMVTDTRCSTVKPYFYTERKF